MSEQISIRPYEPADLTEVERIRAAAYVPVFQSFRYIVGPQIARKALTNLEGEQGDHLAEICDPASKYHLYVAEADGNIVGFCCYSCDDEQKVGEIGLNAVDPDHANQGIGTALYEYALERMKEQGMEAATVGTGLDDSHAPARRAYEKAGFGPGLPTVYLYRLL